MNHRRNLGGGKGGQLFSPRHLTGSNDTVLPLVMFLVIINCIVKFSLNLQLSEYSKIAVHIFRFAIGKLFEFTPSSTISLDLFTRQWYCSIGIGYVLSRDWYRVSKTLTLTLFLLHSAHFLNKNKCWRLFFFLIYLII